jgi:integrase
MDTKVSESSPPRIPWNRGRIVGPKPPLKPRHIWAIRTRLQHERRVRDLAMFNLAIDSKLRGCDLVHLRVSDVHLGDSLRSRSMVVQQKTGRPVPFELTEPTRAALGSWLSWRDLRPSIGYSRAEAVRATI